MVLRDPVEWVCALYEERRGEVEELGWSLADVYLELGGGGPESSELHGRFGDFFNGQTRGVLAAGRERSKLEYWAGIPERGAALRDLALEALGRDRVVEAEWSGSASRPDPRTRSLVLAHNQIDAELHARFAGAAERDRLRARRPAAGGQTSSEAVCILGMSRSGTSLVARILNVLGVALGPEESLLPPAADNPSGFWEHAGIAELNDEILATLSDRPHQHWRWPPRLDEGWERDPRLERHRRAAEEMLRQSFAGLPLWGWKDPRACVTLPFWQQLAPRMRYVICVRHPLDVAGSLELRDGLSREEALQLWLRYTSQAIVDTSGRPRAFVSYEGFFPDWEGQTIRLAELIGLPTLSQARRAAIAAHVEEGLWHHREGAGGATSTAASAALPPTAADFYAQLVALCGPQPETDPAAEARLDAAARRIVEAPNQA
jgi:Sulfotransferase family